MIDIPFGEMLLRELLIWSVGILPFLKVLRITYCLGLREIVIALCVTRRSRLIHWSLAMVVIHCNITPF